LYIAEKEWGYYDEMLDLPEFAGCTVNVDGQPTLRHNPGQLTNCVINFD